MDRIIHGRAAPVRSSQAPKLPELSGYPYLLDYVSWGGRRGGGRVEEGGGWRREQEAGSVAWACVRVRALRFTDCASSTRSPRSRI